MEDFLGLLILLGLGFWLIIEISTSAGLNGLWPLIISSLVGGLLILLFVNLTSSKE